MANVSVAPSPCVVRFTRAGRLVRNPPALQVAVVGEGVEPELQTYLDAPATYELRLQRGDAAIFDLLFRADGADLVLPFGELWMTIKESASDADADAVAQLTTRNGITLVGDQQTATRARLMIPASTFDLLTLPGYVYDLQVRPRNATRVYTALRGSLFVVQDATRERGTLTYRSRIHDPI